MDVFDGRPAVYCSCAFTLVCMDGCFCNVSESIMLCFVAYHTGVCGRDGRALSSDWRTAEGRVGGGGGGGRAYVA